MWPLGIGKINNINHFDFELPAKKVKSQSVHSQEQEAGDAFEKVSFPSGQKGMTQQNNCWKRSFYLAHLLAPSSQGAKLCPWGWVEKTQSVLGMTALCIGQDGCGVSSPWSQHSRSSVLAPTAPLNALSPPLPRGCLRSLETSVSSPSHIAHFCTYY